MEVLKNGGKPHVVCIPCPFQSHIKAMLKLAKLLHHKGFHITFVNTEYNHKRFLKARGTHSLDGFPDFQFETIPDGLPPSDSVDSVNKGFSCINRLQCNTVLSREENTISFSTSTDSSQSIVSVIESIRKNMLSPFLNLVAMLNDKSTVAASSSGVACPVTCILADGFMSFTITAAEQLGIPVVMFFTLSACAFMGFYQFNALVEKGLAPLKDASYMTNGYLDTVIDWIPGMKEICLKDLPSYIQTTNPDDIAFNFCMEATQSAFRASAITLHTFDALEQDLLDALRSIFPSVYSVGPLQLLLDHVSKKDVLESIGYNLWEEEFECLKWLDSKKPGSVIYLNFGSVASLTHKQLEELAWGLVNSHHDFLWIIRPDLVMGDQSNSILWPPELAAEIKERGLIVEWCPQEEVLNHRSVGGFVTHCGWNSIIESLSVGVPMICWPFFGDQQTNCRYACREWEVGLEIRGDVKRDEVEKVFRELMGGEKGKKMKCKAMKWKELAEKATGLDGSSTLSLSNLVNKMLVSTDG